MPAPHPTGGQLQGMARGCWQGAGEGGGRHTPASLASPGQRTPRCGHKAEPPPPARLGGGTPLPFHPDRNPGSPTCQLRDPRHLTSQKPRFPSKRGNGIPASQGC